MVCFLYNVTEQVLPDVHLHNNYVNDIGQAAHGDVLAQESKEQTVTEINDEKESAKTFHNVADTDNDETLPYSTEETELNVTRNTKEQAVDDMKLAGDRENPQEEKVKTLVV